MWRNRMGNETDEWGSPPSPTLGERAATGFSRLVNAILFTLVALVLLYAGYALVDTFGVLNKALATQNNLMQYKPDEQSLREKFAQLQAINPDVCAWVTIDNTHIDYPVVRGEKDFTYLNTDVYGDYSASGSIFLTSANKPDFTDNYVIMMGHHMQAGAMFGDLQNFLDEDFFQKNISGRVYLPDRILELETVEVVTADAYDRLVYTVPSYDTTALVQRLSELAEHQRGEPLDPNEQIIALSTCASSSTNARTVLVCRVIEEKSAWDGEDEPLESN